MTKASLMIWERKFNLPAYCGSDAQDGLVAHDSASMKDIALSQREVDESLRAVREYCASNVADIAVPSQVDNVFKYVMPRELFVENMESGTIVAILCDSKFDEEHGIAVVFENGAFKGIFNQDEVL